MNAGRINEAIQLHQSGDLTTAEARYREIISTTPDQIDALHLLGLLCHETSRSADAIDLLNRAIKILPENEVIQNSLAVVLIAEHRWEEADRHLQLALNRNPLLVEAYFNQGLVSLAIRSDLEASQAFEQATRIDTQHSKSWLELAEIARKQGNWWRAEECLSCCEKAADQDSREFRTKIAITRAKLCCDRRQWDDAIALLSVHTSIENPNAELHRLLAVSHQARDEQELAIDQFKASLRQEPLAAQTHFGLSVSLMAEDRNDECLEHGIQAYKIESSTTNAIHLAACYRLVGAEFEALDTLTQALELNHTDSQAKDPESDNRHLMLEVARHHEAVGSLDEAIGAYEETLALHPTFAIPLLELAQLCERTDRGTHTVDACAKILKTEPDSVAANLTLGLTFLRRVEQSSHQILGEDTRTMLIDKALQMLSKAARLAPSADTFEALGQAVLLSGNHVHAIEHFDRSIDFDGDRHCSFQGRARANAELGNIDAAVADYHEAVRLFPAAGESQYELSRFDTDLNQERIDELVQLVQANMGSVSNRSLLHFALARRLEAAGRYELAFEQFRVANEIKQRPTDHSTQAKSDELTEGNDQVLCAAKVIQVFQETRSHCLAGGNDSQKPIFIVGMPRSGTTLTESILSMHPSVVAGGELSLISSLHKHIGAKPHRRITTADAIEFGDAYLAQLPKLAPESARPEVTRVTDKMPTNFRVLDLIATVFPQATVIHLVREPLDVCLSCFKQNLHWPFSDLDAIAKYYGEYLTLMNHWRSVLPISMIDVDYERLVRSPESECQRLFSFCELEWSSECLEFASRADAVRTPSKWQVRQPIYQSSLGGWRRYAKQLEPLRQALTKHGVECGKTSS